jgi:hypothetical protein
VKGRTSFAFSNVRGLIAEAVLYEDFDRVCRKTRQTHEKFAGGSVAKHGGLINFLETSVKHIPGFNKLVC